jgi:hypothetical protein
VRQFFIGDRTGLGQIAAAVVVGLCFGQCNALHGELRLCTITVL